MGRGKTAVVLDLSAVEFIDSTGLSVLLNGLRRVTRQRGRMALVCTNPTVLRLFEITRLDATFDIHAQPRRRAQRGALGGRLGRRPVGDEDLGQLDAAVLALAVLEQGDHVAPRRPRCR